MVVNSGSKKYINKFEINFICRYHNFSVNFETLYIFYYRCKDLAYVIRDLRKTTLLPSELSIFNGCVEFIQRIINKNKYS